MRLDRNESADGRGKYALIRPGNRLDSIVESDGTFHSTRGPGSSGGPAMAIAVDRLPGPMGDYLVAVVRYRYGDQTERIIPIHTAQRFVRPCEMRKAETIDEEQSDYDFDRYLG